MRVGRLWGHHDQDYGAGLALIINLNIIQLGNHQKCTQLFPRARQLIKCFFIPANKSAFSTKESESTSGSCSYMESTNYHKVLHATVHISQPSIYDCVY